MAISDKKVGIELNSHNKLKTLHDMYNFYIENNTHKSLANTKSRYKQHLEGERFSTKHITLITLEELKDFKRNLLKKKAFKKDTFLTNKSINEIILLAVRLVNYAIQEEKFNGPNPFSKIKKEKVDNIRIKQMSDEDFEIFFNAMKSADKRYPSSKNDYRIGYLFTLLALTTGAREQTILNIKIKNISFENNTIRLYNFKNEEYYIGHIVSDTIKEIIKEIIENNGFPNREYLFCLRDTEKKYANYPKQVKRVLDKEINSLRDTEERIAIKDFRNVFATRLINKKMNLKFIQKFLNHKTPNMTARYAQILDEEGGDDLRELSADIKF